MLAFAIDGGGRNLIRRQDGLYIAWIGGVPMDLWCECGKRYAVKAQWVAKFDQHHPGDKALKMGMLTDEALTGYLPVCDSCADLMRVEDRVELVRIEYG